MNIGRQRVRKLLGFVIFALLLLPQLVASQQQNIIYVNRTDPTCGGQAPCYATIQDAVDAAQPGSIIRIQAGIYPEQISIEKNKFPNATEFDRIVIEADPALQPGQVVLTGASGPQCTERWAIRIKQSKFITIRGLTITGTGGQAISLMGGNNGNQEIHIELNRIFGNGSSSCNGGITIARGNPGTLIVNNLVYGNGRNAITFEDADGGPHYVINNTIYGNQWNGIEVARNHIVTIANNIVNKNGTACRIDRRQIWYQKRKFHCSSTSRYQVAKQSRLRQHTGRDQRSSSGHYGYWEFHTPRKRGDRRERISRLRTAGQPFRKPERFGLPS